jgi:hypothetical protein
MTSGAKISDVLAGPPPVLTDILLSSLEALVAQGQADAACRFAGEACAALRGRDPVGWRRFNAFLHRTAKYVSMEDVPG